MTSTGPSSAAAGGLDAALHGIVVVDFTQVYLGPSCTQLLGDYGADVIKIERPGVGDLSRRDPADEGDQNNPIFLSINRNKRSLCIDLRTDAGKAVVHRLIRRADVVVSNFRAGVMERMGFGYEAVKEINPRIIWASANGFGDDGPYSHKGGQDVIAQAYSGVMWRRESDDLPLSVYPTTLCDYTAGMHLMQGVLLALIARQSTGRGQKVQVAMYDSMLHMQMQEACMQLNRGYEVNWAAMPLCGVFDTKDGAICMVGAFKDNPLRDISHALEFEEDLSQRAEFAAPALMAEHRSALRELFRDRLQTDTTGHWLERLDAEGILCAPVHTLADALADEQTATNRMITAMVHPTAGVVRAVAAPIKLSDTPSAVRHHPPMLGEHNREVLLDLGYSADEVDALVAGGVLQ